MQTMLSVLLLILKIIGIILLAILGIVLLVLLVPICYRVDIDLHDGEFGVKVKVHWLKIIVNFLLEYKDKVSFRLRVFGIKAVKSEDESEDMDKVEETTLKSDDSNVKEDDSNEINSKENDSKESNSKESNYIDDANKDDGLDKFDVDDESSQDIQLTKIAEKEKKKQNKEEARTKKKEARTKKKEARAKKKEARAKKREEKARKKANGENFLSKIKSNKYVKIVRDDSFKPALSHTWKLLKKTLKHVLPRRLKGQIIVGIDNPALLGQMYGFIGLFFGPSGRWLNKLTIVPDFVNTGADISARLKGRVTIGVLLVYFLRLYFNKDVKRVIKMSKQKDEEKKKVV